MLYIGGNNVYDSLKNLKFLVNTMIKIEQMENVNDAKFVVEHLL